jgi:hypothetical protein
MFGGHDEMTAGIAVFIIHEDDHFSIADIVDGLFYSAKRGKLTHDKLPGDV